MKAGRPRPKPGRGGPSNPRTSASSRWGSNSTDGSSSPIWTAAWAARVSACSGSQEAGVLSLDPSLFVFAYCISPSRGTATSVHSAALVAAWGGGLTVRGSRNRLAASDRGAGCADDGDRRRVGSGAPSGPCLVVGARAVGGVCLCAGSARGARLDARQRVCDRRARVRGGATASTIYLGGSFSQVGPRTGPWVSLSAASGQVDSAMPQVWGGFAAVNAVVADGSGGFYIGGSFTSRGAGWRARTSPTSAPTRRSIRTGRRAPTSR